jgi:hypothetical protein
LPLPGVAPCRPYGQGAFGAIFRHTGTGGDADFARGLVAQIVRLVPRIGQQTAGIDPKRKVVATEFNVANRREADIAERDDRRPMGVN